MEFSITRASMRHAECPLSEAYKKDGAEGWYIDVPDLAALVKLSQPAAIIVRWDASLEIYDDFLE